MGQLRDVQCAQPSVDVTMSLRGGVEDLARGQSEWNKGNPVFFCHPLLPRSSLGKPHLAPFCYDLKHPANAIVACAHRFARQMPTGDAPTVNHFKEFATRCIVKLFSPPQKDSLPTFEAWLARSSYSGGRKTYLARLHRELVIMDYELTKNDSFLKAEVYQTTAKLPRGINSYSDASKTVLGGLFHCVDKATFVSRFFVKNSDPRTWPERCAQLFGESRVISTDFTSFEAHHTGSFAWIVHYWFSYMTSALPIPGNIRTLVKRLMLGRNIIKFGHVNVECDQRLMSGALWTSSANGVLNLLIHLYLASRAVFGVGDVDVMSEWATSSAQGLVEGDDGLFTDYGQSDDVALSLGCILKVERHERFEGAGFCGIVCDRDEMQIVKDPIKFLRNFFVLPARYRFSGATAHDQLLRAKAMSYYYMFRNCPIIGPVCKAILDRTSAVTARSTGGSWIENWLDAAVKDRVWNQQPEVGMASRQLVERTFGVSIEEQLAIERQAQLDPARIDLSQFTTDDDSDFVGRYIMPEHVWPGHDTAPSQVAVEIYNICSNRNFDELKAISRGEPSRLTAQSKRCFTQYHPVVGEMVL